MTGRPLAWALAFGVASVSRAWDPGGHMLVGEIAWQVSTPEVRERVEVLVRGLDPRFAGGQKYNFTTAGCWMDDMRSLRQDYQWSKWHYVEILKTDDASGFKVPEPPHVIWAIGQSLATLRDANAAADRRTEAMGFLIHCVGDIHQPLHCCGWDDRGGNGYLLSGVGFADVFPGTKPNLHAFWDEGYRVEPREGTIGESVLIPKVGNRPQSGAAGPVADEAKAVMNEFPAELMAGKVAVLDPTKWARESYRLGCTKGYPPGPRPEDYEVRKIDGAFATETRKVARERVALAGYRLARVLADVLRK